MENEDKQSDSYFLYISAFTADLVVFASGYTMTWSSPVFQKLKEPNQVDNPLGETPTAVQESWLASIMCLGAAIGPFFLGKLADILGRKKALMIVALPFLIGYIILTFATNMILFYIARFITGLSLGSSFAVLPMYLGEIAEDHNRGRIGCIITIFITLGLLYPLAVGPLLSIKMFNLSCALPLVLFLIIFFLFIPESPVYLVSIGDQKGAEEALKKIRNKSSGQIEKEISKISQDLEKLSGDKGGISELIKSPPLRKGIIITVGLIVLQQCAGVQAINSFMASIFVAAGSRISPYVSTIIIGVLQIFTSIFTSAVVEKLGRRFLLLVSSVGCGAAITILGLYFYLKNSTTYNVDPLFWLPVTSMMVYFISFSVGLSPLPWAILGEVFPSHVKAVASALTSFSCFSAGFVISYIFPIISANMGMAQCFWLFGFFCVLTVVFVFIVVPETKGKSLAQIQELLSGN